MLALYDTFLIQEPLRQDPFAVTHNPSDRATLIGVYSKSIEYFDERDRTRAVERLKYELGMIYVRQGEWSKALNVLEPLWRSVSWRREGWWELLEGLGETVRDCALRCEDGETVVRQAWEGMSSCLRQGSKDVHDLSKCLDAMDKPPSKPRTVVRAGETVSCLSFTFGFDATQGNVGELLPAQLAIASHARNTTVPIVLSHVQVSFDGSLRDLRIEHEAETESIQLTRDEVRLQDIALSTASSRSNLSGSGASASDCLFGTFDLTFHPGEARILSFDLVPRDSCTIRVASITSTLETESFELEYVVSESEYIHQPNYWFRTPEGVGWRPRANDDNSIRIHPKPPKVQINVPGLGKEYLTDETVRLEVDIVNEENDDVEVTLEARFLGQADAVPTWKWITHQEEELPPEDPLNERTEVSTPSYEMGHVKRSGSRMINASFTATRIATEAVLEIKAAYHTFAEPDKLVSKVMVKEIIFDRPFEVNYEFQPRVDSRPLPNYFHITDNGDPPNTARGLRQLWHLSARLASLALEHLVIEDIELELPGVSDGALCRVGPSTPTVQRPQVVVAPDDFHETRFNIDAQKFDLDDRRATAFKFQILIRWRRNQSHAPLTTTIVPAPSLVIPFGEPRVLATLKSDEERKDSDFIPLEYTVENPSTHVLSFDISMETNDDFAFSGPKTTSLQLVPVSRHVLRYNIVPLAKGKWITPGLKVLDTHFNQVLKIHGTGGMRSDKKGASIWVDAEE
ncbi:MAG: hypothetical protein Q9219_006907 [cf. Caloplaca sp. 3 TL-2023]